MPEIYTQLSENLHTVRATSDPCFLMAINAIDANEKSLKALNAAMKSSDNIVNGICSAITRAENTTITVVLSPEDISELASHRKALNKEEKFAIIDYISDFSHYDELSVNRKLLSKKKGRYWRTTYKK